MGLKPITTAAAACAAALLALGACDRQADKPARADRAGADASSPFETRAERKAERKAAKRATREGRQGGDGVDSGDTGDNAAVDVSGIPATVKWAGNRRNSAQEQLAKRFRQNGSDFGAVSAVDYAAKVNAFVSNPPRGTKTATRGNGDKLFYDPATNTFAVVNRRGLPKIMMKPEEGAAYWQQQLTELNNYGKGRRQARRDRAGADADAG